MSFFLKICLTVHN